MVAIYVRQSIDKQDSVSTDVQAEFCRRELAPGEDSKVYTDKGYSGKNMERPAFRQLLSDIEHGRISKMVVYRLDRISRSITDFAGIMDILGAHNVDFVSSTEKFDTSTPMGRAMLYIIMVFAQLERETIAERIKDNYYSRGKQGVFLGGPPPLGFDNVKLKEGGKHVTVLRPNQDIEIVQKIFHRYASSDRSLGDIAREFQELYGNDFGTWNNIKLSRILHNPVYVRADADVYHHYRNLKCSIANDISEFTGARACYLFGKRDRGANKYRNLDEHVLALATHEGVVDSETFLRCQYKLSSNRQIRNSGRGKYTWLTGLVKCGYCGYSLTVKKYRENLLFYCSGKQNNRCTEVVKSHYLEEVESYVDSEMIAAIRRMKKDAALLNPKETADNETNSLKIELYQTEEQIDKLLSTLTEANDVLIHYVNEKITTLDEKKRQLLKEIAEKTTSKKDVEIPDLDEWLSGDMTDKKKIAKGLIHRVNVYNNEIQILWKY